MIAEPVELPWGRGEVLPMRIPSAWQVVAQSDPKPPAPIADLDGAIQERLDGLSWPNIAIRYAARGYDGLSAAA